MQPNDLGKILNQSIFFLLGHFVDRVLLVFHAFGAAPVDPWEKKKKKRPDIQQFVNGRNIPLFIPFQLK
jgi:hypothetical protein